MPGSGSSAARLSLILAAVAAIIALFAPLGASVESEAVAPLGPAPTSPPVVLRTNLLQEEGPRAIALATFPVLLAAIPVVGERLRPGSRALRIVAAVALWLFVAAGLASIGWFYVPSAVAMTVAAAARVPAPGRG